MDLDQTIEEEKREEKGGRVVVCLKYCSIIIIIILISHSIVLGEMALFYTTIYYRYQSVMPINHHFFDF